MKTEFAHLQTLTKVKEFIENVRHDISRFFFLNLFAPSGFGKTEFVEKLWEEYELEVPTSQIKVIDFFEKDSGGMDALLIKIIQDLDLRLPKRITELPANYEHGSDTEDLAKILVKLIIKATQFEQTILLLLDDYDHLPSEQRSWFELRVLSKIAKTKRVAIILTSEYELRFAADISLRMRLDSYELPSLDKDAISRLLPGREEVASEVYKATGGFPVLADELIQQLRDTQIATADEFQRQEGLLRKYYGTLVRETILRDKEPVIRDTLLTLALLRRFDVIVLDELLPKVMGVHFEGYDTADYLDLIEQLGSQARWRMQGGYALNKSIRAVLEGYVRFIEPGYYDQVNRAALAMYRELLDREYREYYLVELLYHRLILLLWHNNHSSERIEVVITKEISRYLYDESTATIKETDLDSLRHTLTRDKELKPYISKDVMEEIKRLINARAFESQTFEKAEEKEILK